MYLREGLQVARQENDVRSRIFSLWRQGALALTGGELESAEESLSQALGLSRSSDILEFEIFIMLDLGRVREELRQWDHARSAFQFVVDNTSEDSESYEEIKARKEAQEKLIRLLLKPQYHRWSDPVFWAVVIALLIAIAMFLYQGQHLRRYIREIKRPIPPEPGNANPPTPQRSEQHPIPSTEHFHQIAYALGIDQHEITLINTMDRNRGS